MQRNPPHCSRPRSTGITLSIANCEMAHLNQARVQAHRWHFITIADYVDLVGTDAETGAVCRERVTQM